MPRDLVAKPSTGRRFPLEFHELAQCVEGLGFAASDSTPRLQIILENCRVEVDRGRQLSTLSRRNYLAVFSLPEEVKPLLARRALLQALDSFVLIDRGPWLTTNEQQFVVYRAFLGAMGEVSVTEHVVGGVSRSYLKFRKVTQLPRAGYSTRGQREIARHSVA